MKIRITGVVQHNGHLLELHEIYEINDFDAQEMIRYGLAEEYTGNREALNPGDPIVRDKTPPDHYSAEAVPTRPLKEDEVDNKPVIEPTHQPEVEPVVDDPEAPVVPEKTEEEVVVPTGPQNDGGETPPDDSVISKE